VKSGSDPINPLIHPVFKITLYRGWGGALDPEVMCALSGSAAASNPAMLVVSQLLWAVAPSAGATFLSRAFRQVWWPRH